MLNVYRLLKDLKEMHLLTNQQYRTYTGQVKHGDAKGCMKGLLRSGLITSEDYEKYLENEMFAYSE